MGAVAEFPKLFIISELCHRGSLHRILHAKKELPWHRRLSFAIDCARGCHFLHTHTPYPIVHLDLKSPNLFVDKHMTLKLGDFGLAREKKHSVYVSQGCGGVGTPQWSAPEVLKGEPFNEFADVYSFGVILWELATRKTPFEGLMPIQVVVEVGLKNQRLQLQPDEANPQFRALADECMATSWSQRPGFDTILERVARMHRASMKVIRRNSNSNSKAGVAAAPAAADGAEKALRGKLSPSPEPAV